MRLLEHEAKHIFRQHGIRVPSSILVRRVAEVEKAYHSLKGAVVIKPQTFSKQRGKAGLIRVAQTLGQTLEVVEGLLRSTFQGERIREVLLEEFIDGETEVYMAIAVDRAKGRPVAILSSKGGVDIERVAKEYPGRLASVEVNVLQGLSEGQVRDLAETIGVIDPVREEVISTLLRLYEIFRRYDAEIVEINPLIVTREWKAVAVDAVLNIDDASIFRHPKLNFRRRGARTLEERAAHLDLSFVELDGNIGIIGNGAGLTMATSDIVQMFGGRPAYFLDVGGGTSSEGIKRALSFALGVETNVVLLNIFAGISQCDEVASGIAEITKEGVIDQPLVVRMVGTNQEEGRRILESIGISVFTSMEDAVRKTVELAEGVV